MNKILRINVKTKTIVYEDIKNDYQYLGGRGLTSQIILDEIEPGCDPLGANNKIILAPGLLSGTKAPNSGRLSIGGKSPLTKTIKESNVGGTAAHKIARLGLKAIIIEDKAQVNGCYVVEVLKNETKLVAADGLAGKGNYDTMRELKARYGDNAAIICIGPAGENLYPTASVAVSDIDGNASRHAGRGGLGAVLGSKGIKAIVVDDSGSVSIEANDKFNDAAKKFARALTQNPVSGGALPNFGTAVLVNMVNGLGALPTRNFKTGQFEKVLEICGEKLSEIIKARGGKTGHHCLSGCVIGCSNVINDKNGKYVTSGLEYETIAMFGANCALGDLNVVAELDYMCDNYGVDTIEIANSIAVLMDAGVIKFGDAGAVKDAINNIIQGTGLGRIIAQGAAATGKEFGVKRVPVVKGQSLAAYDPRAIKGNGVVYATSPMGADHTCGNALGHPAVDPLKPESQVEVSKQLQSLCAGIDCTGLCLFTFFAIGENPENLGLVADMINNIHGTVWHAGNIIGIGQQVLEKERAFNRKAGFSSVDDRLPEFMYAEPLPPHNTVFDISDDDLGRVFE